jgi:hypothetical protein
MEDSPAMKKSPAPPNGGHGSDMDYYARYGEVQPEMDNEGDHEEMAEPDATSDP